MTDAERVCARCRVAAYIPADGARQTVIAMKLLPFGDAKTAAGIVLVALDEARERIEAACIAAHHAREDAALVAEIQAKHHLYRGYTGDARKECGHGCGLWPCDAARLAARLAGGKR